MKNKIAKAIHTWSNNFLLNCCLALLLIGTSEWLMHSSEIHAAAALEQVDAPKTAKKEDIFTKLWSKFVWKEA